MSQCVVTVVTSELSLSRCVVAVAREAPSLVSIEIKIYLKPLLHYASLWLHWVTKRKGICVGNTSSPYFTNLIIIFRENALVICK